jgi:lysophospholipase L1-like esterase
VGRPPGDILRLNAWMKDYAASAGAVYADYYSAVVDQAGFFKEGFSNDGLHPNPMGYTLMAPVAEAAIDKVVH